MKFTELSAYDLPGGTVIEWSALTELAPRHWSADFRPLTYEHEELVTRAAEAESQGRRQTDWLGAVFEISGVLDQDAMARTLLAWTARHEAFHTTVTMDSAGDNTFRPVRRTCTPEMLAMRRSHHGHIDRKDIVSHLVDTFDSRISPLGWPHCAVMTVSDTGDEPGRQDRFHVVFAADHTVMDAYSLLLSINELQLIYESEVARQPVTAPAVGSHVDFSSGNRRAGEQLDGDHSAVAQWRTFLAASADRFPQLGMPLAETLSAVDASKPIDQLQSGWADVVATADEVAALDSACRAVGHSVQTAIVTALAIAHHELTGNPRFRAVMPMHTRHEPRFMESVGWYVGLGPLDVDLSTSTTISEALEAAATGTRTAKKLSRLPFPRIAHLLGIDHEPTFVVSYLDLRVVPGATQWSDWRAQTVRSATRSDSEVYLWIARTPTGITVSARHPGTEAAAAGVRRLIDMTFSVIVSVTDSVNVSVTDSGTGQPLTIEPLSGRDERRPA
ncbi:MAG: condensation domain-containing protein [Actinomycetota bacterium]|nr:condensation domain-containing protein [Actinomycetota bacterium]